MGLGGCRLYANDNAVVVVASHEMGGFALPPTAPIEHATFHGRVVAYRCGQVKNAIVEVGGTLVHVDAKGTYRATIDASGIVTVGGGMSPIWRRDGGPANANAIGHVHARRPQRLCGAGSHV